MPLPLKDEKLISPPPPVTQGLKWVIPLPLRENGLDISEVVSGISRFPFSRIQTYFVINWNLVLY